MAECRDNRMKVTRATPAPVKFLKHLIRELEIHFGEKTMSSKIMKQYKPGEAIVSKDKLLKWRNDFLWFEHF